MKLRTIHPRIIVPVISIMVIAALLVFFISPFSHAEQAARRVALADAVSPLISNSQPLANTPANQKIALSIGLNLRNAANLTSYLQQISSPSSPLYRRYLNPDSFAALYGPLPQSEAAVVNYLRSQGFTITGTYANHLLIDAVGTVAQAEAAFQVQINNYRSSSGHTIFANANTPSLPVAIAPLISSVSGLDESERIQIAGGRRPVGKNQTCAGHDVGALIEIEAAGGIGGVGNWNRAAGLHAHDRVYLPAGAEPPVGRKRGQRIVEGRGEALPGIEGGRATLRRQVAGVLRKGRAGHKVDAIGCVVNRLGPDVASQSGKVMRILKACDRIESMVDRGTGRGKFVHGGVS